ncbi:putative Rossmann fold nucleotide-binding protein DprA/Smf involved in DNA uptake [Lachnospiraceae bacterium PF1-22]
MYSKEARIIIAGSRDFLDYKFLKEKCDEIIQKLTEYKITIISGTARGADTLGEQYAKENNYILKRMPANWNDYGKSAGPRRNEEMAKYAKEAAVSILIAFSNGSKGTGHMINSANKHELQIFTFTFSKRE